MISRTHPLPRGMFHPSAGSGRIRKASSRRKKLPFGAGLIFVLLLSACAAEVSPRGWMLDPGNFSGARALDECAAFVRLGPKASGTEGAHRAAEHLAERLDSMGYTPELDVFEDPAPGGPLVFRNVIARTSGSGPVERIILIGAHYDTKGSIENFEGANDSGSGVGALLEILRLVAETPPPPGVEIRGVFFDGEECRRAYGPRDGLHGSRRMAAQAVREGWASKVAGVIILDMIGDQDLNITLPANVTPSLAQLLFRAAEAENVRPQVAWSRHDVLDDHVPFLNSGMPAVNLIDFEYGSAPGLNDYWHTSEDRMEHL
nr:M28 family peptidase [Kiritimatiellia bacterium]